ncbi:MAG TPA: DUF3611 family protein [Dongiaceae bacterium]|nr:DUF3611 family protein [Dongiaceae bacterium]
MLGTKPSISGGLARLFSRLGWIGFWLQIAIGSVPVALLIYALLFSKGGVGTRGSFALLQYLSMGSLLLLAFTTIWFYRYTRLGRRNAEPDRRPRVSSAQRIAWIGVAASTVSIVFSALVMMFEVTQLLFYFLRAPQAGIPVFQTTSGGPASWVSASDILGLMGLIFTMLVEVIVLALSLWLLFRSTAELAEIHAASDEDLTADIA